MGVPHGGFMRKECVVEQNRKITLTKKPLKGCENPLDEPPEKLLGYVWPLSAEVIALGGRYDVKQRLQRHVTRLIRRKR
jgi:hypothetical protein